MARKGGQDRGITQRKDRPGWWVRLYANGRQQWFRCDTKSQAKALYGRLKADHREGKYFEKARAVPFREIARITHNISTHAAAGKGMTAPGCTAGSQPFKNRMRQRSLPVRSKRCSRSFNTRANSQRRSFGT